jgi:hypothetical protein
MNRLAVKLLDFFRAHISTADAAAAAQWLCRYASVVADAFLRAKEDYMNQVTIILSYVFAHVPPSDLRECVFVLLDAANDDQLLREPKREAIAGRLFHSFLEKARAEDAKVDAEIVRELLERGMDADAASGLGQALIAKGTVDASLFDDHFRRKTIDDRLADRIMTVLDRFYPELAKRPPADIKDSNMSFWFRSLQIVHPFLSAERRGAFIEKFAATVFASRHNGVEFVRFVLVASPEHLPAIATHLTDDVVGRVLIVAQDEATVTRLRAVFKPLWGVLKRLQTEFVVQFPRAALLDYLADEDDATRASAEEFARDRFPQLKPLPGFVAAEQLLREQDWPPLDRAAIAAEVQDHKMTSKRSVKDARDLLAATTEYVTARFDGLRERAAPLVRVCLLLLQRLKSGGVEPFRRLFEIAVGRKLFPDAPLLELMRLVTVVFSPDERRRMWDASRDDYFAGLVPGEDGAGQRLLAFIDCWGFTTELMETNGFAGILAEVITNGRLKLLDRLIGAAKAASPPELFAEFIGHCWRNAQGLVLCPDVVQKLIESGLEPSVEAKSAIISAFLTSRHSPDAASFVRQFVDGVEAIEYADGPLSLDDETITEPEMEVLRCCANFNSHVARDFVARAAERAGEGGQVSLKSIVLLAEMLAFVDDREVVDGAFLWIGNLSGELMEPEKVSPILSALARVIESDATYDWAGELFDAICNVDELHFSEGCASFVAAFVASVEELDNIWKKLKPALELAQDNDIPLITAIKILLAIFERREDARDNFFAAAIVSDDLVQSWPDEANEYKARFLQSGA